MENKTLKTEVENFIKTRTGCQNCPNNPKAKEPYKKMRQYKVTPLTEKVLDQMKEKYGVEPCCFACFSVDSFMQMTPEKRLIYLQELAKHKN